jgi:hypothetical protein
MRQCATASRERTVPAPIPVQISFDAGPLTSDGGLIWLSEAEAEVGLCAFWAAQIDDWRRGPVRHSLEVLLRQRIFQIACGYTDQNDADTLRRDPLLKVVCGRWPERDSDLASQPTFSRLEKAIDRRTCYRLAMALVLIYIQERGRRGRPTPLVLDLDTTDDPTHGAQEGSAYHGYYRRHMYHPLLIFDGETNQLLTAVLRPGNAHASRGVVAILKRLVRALRLQWPGVAIELRADSGFATPALYAFCEQAGLGFTIGLIPNPRLEAAAVPLLAAAQAEQTTTAAEKVRLASEVAYQAGSWAAPRRVVFKAEVTPKGPNTRFVVTTRPDAPLALYDWYVDRGEPELWIKDFKRACAADRLSDHRFWANQFRLLLHAAAYWLLDTLRRWLADAGIVRMQLDTLRLRLIKIGGRVQTRLTDVRLRLASSHPGEPLWWLLDARPPGLPWRRRPVNNSG